MIEAGREGTPQLSEFMIIMQRLKQVTLEKRALEAVVGTVQKEVQEAKTESERVICADVVSYRGE